MKSEDTIKKLRECIKNAKREEEEGKKHKGLFIVEPNDKSARDYIQKAKDALGWCEVYKIKGADYKIPEEWYYTLYYCALAFLAKLGIESRSQKYTALFLFYMQDKGVINFGKEFIDSITVHKEKGKESEVDKREEALYSPSIKMEKVAERYDEMMQFCKKAILQTEEIIFSNKPFIIPKELLE
ncbi:hypothetical protein HYW75_01275 [Candidatus Pacearchaeota archaeon]|nr:hypothetical protein [Candidatus Pacearchaeota archaeon]